MPVSAFLGRWRLVQQDRDHYDAVLEAFGTNDTFRARMKNAPHWLVRFGKCGDKYTITKYLAMGTFSKTFEFGKEFDDWRGDGSHWTSVIVEKDGKLVRTMKQPGKTATIVYSVDRNVLTAVVTIGSLTATLKFVKDFKFLGLWKLMDADADNYDKALEAFGSTAEFRSMVKQAGHWLLEFNKEGPVVTITKHLPTGNFSKQFEFDKEFDDKRADGSHWKSVVREVPRNNGYVLVRTMTAPGKSAKITYEVFGQVLIATVETGNVCATLRFHRQVLTPFLGKWTLVDGDHDNYDKALQAFGATAEFRSAMKTANNWGIQFSLKGPKITITKFLPNGTFLKTFELNKEFDDQRADGSHWTSVVRVEGAKLDRTMKSGGKIASIVYKAVGGVLTATVIIGDVVANLTFKRA